MKNNNTAVVRRLVKRSLSVNKKRNMFIVLAVFLTTFLLGTVFSIGDSLMKSVETEKLRLFGTTADAAIAYPSREQIEKLEGLDYVKAVGCENPVGYARLPRQMDNFLLQLIYFDSANWESLRQPALTDITGNYPQKLDEIMIPLDVLKKMGVTPEIGTEIPLSFFTDENAENSTVKIFRLSGWYKSYGTIQTGGQVGMACVSQALSQKCGKTIEKDGSANLMLTDKRHIEEYLERLQADLQLTPQQQIVSASSSTADNEDYSAAGLIAVSAITAFLILTGYLLIYNVLYISISRDVRFYGLLKTLGTAPKQIKGMVRGQILRLCAIGIPFGIAAALIFSVLAVPAVLSGLKIGSSAPVVSFSPLVYLGAAVFALITAVLGAAKPAKKASQISPVEAQKFTGVNSVQNRRYKLSHGKLYRLAMRNIFREKKRAVIVLCSLFLGITSFIAVTTFVSSMGMDKYVDSHFHGDFLLENSTRFSDDRQDVLNSGFIEEISAMPGVEYLSASYHEFGFIDDTLVTIVGLDAQGIEKVKDAFDASVNLDAFKHGDFAVITADSSEITASSQELFAKYENLSIHPSLQLYEGSEPIPALTVPIGGSVPESLAGIDNTANPIILVSDALMHRLFERPYLFQVQLEVSNEYEQQIFEALKELTEDTEIELTSKRESLKEYRQMSLMLFVLGGSISLIIAVIGILNFVNVMSTGIAVRKHELAILESIGMERKKIRRMLILEGVGYAGIALLLTATIGNGAAYGIFRLLKLQAPYAVFNYPIIPATVISLLVIAVCVITPAIAYRSRATIVEQLREAE